MGRVRVLTPAGPVDVYNAHFIAPYLEFGPDRFAAHRVAQALEAGRYMRTTSEYDACGPHLRPELLPG